MSGVRGVPRLLELVHPKTEHQASFKRELAEHLFQRYKLLSLPTKCFRNLGVFGGERSYMLLGSLAKLEHALMRWSMTELTRRYKFTPVVVPNIIYDNIIEECGFPTSTSRSQVYKIRANAEKQTRKSSCDTKLNQVCLAGTSEFALATLHIGDVIPATELPKRYCAASRCYRAETSRSSLEWGLYRVHYFNKVEMFGFSLPDKSDQLHEEFLGIQKDLFKQLGLRFQILDMPDDDLGASASKKYDVEAWFAGRQKYGEISSTSNCRDYQSSRLNIKYSQMKEERDQLKLDTNYLHTVNGTGCSTIRTILALCEQHQTADGKVKIPKPLQPYMEGIDQLPTNDDSLLLAEVNLYPDS